MDMQESSILNQFALRYQGQDYTFDKPLITIGSDSSCDIRIQNNPQILPMHANLMYRDGRILLRFIGRGAAIWVNGLPVAQQELKDQDEIALGTQETRMTLLLNNVSTLTTSPGIPVNGNPEARTSGLLHRDETGALSRSQPLSLPAKATPSQSGLIMEPALQPGYYAVPPQQIQSPIRSDKQETTRYLCAAGHLDEGFQDYVMRNVIYEDHKALGESYGVDMQTVVSWCKAGINRIMIRDWILTGLLALLIISYFIQLIRVIGGLFQAASNTISSPFSGGLSVVTLVLSVFSFVPITIALIIGYNVEKWVKRRWPKSLPGVVSYVLILISCFMLLAATSSMATLIYISIWLTIFIELCVRYYGGSVKRLRKNAFNPQDKPAHLNFELERKLQENFLTGQRNVIAYSGLKPFAGGGVYKDGWSIVTDTSKGSLDSSASISKRVYKTPLPFRISELYAQIERDMQGLGLKDVLEIEGKIYVRGQYLPEHPDFFNSNAQRPATSVRPELVEYIKDHPEEDVRYYQCLRFNFWRGEMIFTVFLRFVQQGKDLFTEVNYLLLPPMDPDYYWIDKRENTPVLSGFWMLYKLSLDTPLQTWLGAPYRLLRGYRYSALQRKNARIAQNWPAFDYGANTSLRQYASDDRYHLFFQWIDQQMYLRVAEKQILQSVCNFLEAHQIDTDEFTQREQSIINNNTTNNNSNTYNGPVNNSGIMGNNSGGQTVKNTRSAS